MKLCSIGEIKVLFYSVWNVAFEAKQCEFYKECQLMLRQLYETVKKFSTTAQIGTKHTFGSI